MAMDGEARISELQKELDREPESERYFELAELLAEDPAGRAQAREVCFRRLTRRPDDASCRLLLAKLFYLDRMGEFCVRELVELKKRTDAPAIDKLLSAFGGFATPFLPVAAENRLPEGEEDLSASSGENIFAEIDLEVDFSEASEEVERNSDS